jgi:type VI secretion system protein ImpE
LVTAKSLYEAGELQAAIDEVTRAVKSNPSDTRQRTFLFELMCFAGDFDRAERQLDVLGHQSATAEVGVQVYRNNIKAERDRRRLFAEGLHPYFLTDPPPYVELHLDALNRLREGSFGEARQLLDRAEEERPALTGKLNGRQFLDFRDYDDVIGPILELIIQDHYTWLPFEQIKQIEIGAPKQLRDLMWVAARIESTDGTIGEVFIPALYSGSSDHENDQVKLGRMTDWKKIEKDIYLAAGLRLFLVDNEDKAMLEVRTVEFEPVSVGTPS